MTQQPPQSGRSITIRPDDTSISVAQAIYHHVTARTEQIFETHSENYVIEENDIIQLIHKIKQVAQRHHQEESSCVIEHALYKKERVRHSSFESFKISDKSQADPTSEIAIVYDFLSQNPHIGQDADIKPERYKITINITQEQSLLALDRDDGRPSFLPRLSNVPTIGVSIRYVDYTVARSILAATREWVASLNGVKRSRFQNFFLRNQFNLSDMLPKIFTACILLGVAGLVQGETVGAVGASWMLRILALAIFFGSVGSLMAESFTNSIYFTHLPTVINLTKGDAAHIKKLEKKKSRANNIVAFLVVVVLLGIILNVASNFIYDKFF